MTDTTASPAADDAPFQFQRVRSVTLPVLKMEGRKPKYIFMGGPMHQGKAVDKTKGPATVAHCIDLQTGEEGLFICSTVFQNEVHAAYPNHTYVGKGFEVTHTRVPDKRYNIVSVAEVGIPPKLKPLADKLAAQVAADPETKKHLAAKPTTAAAPNDTSAKT